MNHSNYLNYAVIEGTETLIKAHSGFAAESWMESDKAFKRVMAESFVYIDGETGNRLSIRKWKVRRLNSDKEFERLYAKTHPAFKFWIKAEKLCDSSRLNIGQRINANSWFDVGFNRVVEDFPGITPEQWFRICILKDPTCTLEEE